MRLFSLLFGLILLITGCSEQIKEDQLSEMLKNLKKSQYELQKSINTDDAYSYIHEKMKPYLTEKAYNELLTNREAFMSVEAAKNGYYVEVGKITIDQTKEEKETNSINVSYTLELKFSSSKKNVVKTVTAQATIIKVGDTLKIDRNWDSLIAKDVETLD